MSREADSAGRPWAGRTFDHHGTAYAEDDGSAPAAFTSAALALAAGDGSVGDVLDALRGGRLLVPLLAAAGETGVDERGRTVDKTQELSIVTVAGPDGAPILPMFASVAAMQAWDARARPVPSDIRRAAAAALDGPGRIVVDPGAATELVLTRTMLESLLADAPWRASIEDADVQREIVDAMLAAPAVQAVVVASGDPRSRLEGAEVEVHAVVDARPDAAAQLAAAAEALGASALLRERTTSLAVRVRRAGEPLELRAQPTVAVTRAAP